MTDITELAQSLKAAANKAGADDWQAKKISGDFYVIRKGSYSSQCGYRTYQPIAEIDHKSTRDYVAIASPANVLALVEALEKAQETIAFQQGEIKALLSSLESRTVKLPDDEDGQAYGFGKWANRKLPATAGAMTIAYCEDAWRAAFEVFSSAAGIKVEAE
ncbi:ead/Ea22-like family protein [Klebsiella quasipneumoniae subsp. similipneumoniae]